MHAAGLAELGLDDWTYELMPVEPGAIGRVLRSLPSSGYAGVNVTIPYKEAALGLCDVLSDTAREIGAVSLITVLEDGRLHGDNVDAPAFFGALGTPIEGRTALVLGAGGSARSVAWALRVGGCEGIAVWNRTESRARALADELDLDVADSWLPTALLVNCTSVGLHEPERTFRDLPLSETDLAENEIVVDFVYRDGGTPLLQAAARAGARTVDGLSVLAAGGAYSLERWTGRPAPRIAMERALRCG
jgi:shikimate dehydrogenase